MKVAKIFETRKGQIVHLPQAIRFAGNEVVIQQLGDAVILVPKDAAWKTFLEGLHGFSDDFMEDGRPRWVEG